MVLLSFDLTRPNWDNYCPFFLRLAIVYLYAPICGKRLSCIQLKIQFSWYPIHLHTAILFLNPSTILGLYPGYRTKKSQQNVHHPNSFKYSWSPCDLKDAEVSRRMVICDLEDLGVPRAHDLGNLHVPMHPMLLSDAGVYYDLYHVYLC